MVGKRHPSEEVAVKLRQAEEMMAEGKTQREITQALGVSIMTLHRWRKTRGHATTAVIAGSPPPGGIAKPCAEEEGTAHSEALIREMRIENDRLRRLLTDLMLEKMKLEEELRERASVRRKVLGK